MSLAHSHREEPFFFPAGEETLFGILTHPTDDVENGAVIVLPGGSAPTSTGRNRLSVRLTRTAAAHGWHGVRFDFHGVGESTGVAERLRLDEPFADDLLGVIRWLKDERGITRFALVGSCFGSRTALGVSAEPAVEAMCLIAAPVRDFEMGHRISTRLALELTMPQYVRRALQPKVLRGLLNARKRRSYARVMKAKWRALPKGRGGGRGGNDDWISPSFVAHLNRIGERRLPLLLLYGEGDDYLRELQAAMRGPLRHLTSRRGGSSLAVKTVPGQLHGFTHIEAQETVIRLVGDWIASIPTHGKAQAPDRVRRG